MAFWQAIILNGKLILCTCQGDFFLYNLLIHVYQFNNFTEIGTWLAWAVLKFLIVGIPSPKYRGIRYYRGILAGDMTSSSKQTWLNRICENTEIPTDSVFHKVTKVYTDCFVLVLWEFMYRADSICDCTCAVFWQYGPAGHGRVPSSQVFRTSPIISLAHAGSIVPLKGHSKSHCNYGT